MTLKLKSGYDRRKSAPEETYRYMTLEEAKALSYGDKVPFNANDGTVREIKINGQPKTWKRDASRIEVPVKYGMYEFGTFTLQPSGIIGTYAGNAFPVKVEDEEE